MLLLCMRDIANNTPNQIKKLVHKMEENGFCEKSKKKNALIMEKSISNPTNNKNTYKIILTVLSSSVSKTNGNPYFYEFSINLVDSKGSKIFDGWIYYVYREKLTRTCSIIPVVLDSIVDVFCFITRFFGKPKNENIQLVFSASDFFIRYNTEEYLEAIVEFKKSGTRILIKPKDMYEGRSFRKLSDIIDLDAGYIKSYYNLLFKRRTRHAIKKTCPIKKNTKT